MTLSGEQWWEGGGRGGGGGKKKLVYIHMHICANI